MSMTLGADTKSTPIGPNFSNMNYSRMFNDALIVLDDWYESLFESKADETGPMRLLIIDAKTTFIQGIPVEGHSGPMQAKDLKSAVALVIRAFMFDYMMDTTKTPTNEMLGSMVRLSIVNDWLVDVPNESEINAN